METKITTSFLRNDIQYLLKNWPFNPLISNSQLNKWPRHYVLHKAYLSDDAANHLILQTEIGGDNQPVFFLPRIRSRKIFYNKTGSYFYPSISDIIRFGKFFNLGCERTLFLVLKLLWEYYAFKNGFYKYIPGQTDPRVKKSGPEVATADEISAFKQFVTKQQYLPDLTLQPGQYELFTLFNMQNQYAEMANYNDEKFNELIEKAIAINCQQAIIYSYSNSALVSLSRPLIEQLAKFYDMHKKWKNNPRLQYLIGDISYWYETAPKSGLVEYDLICQFKARQKLLTEADECGIVYNSHGDLSHAIGPVLNTLRHDFRLMVFDLP